jgi:hypothetical protein
MEGYVSVGPHQQNAAVPGAQFFPKLPLEVNEHRRLRLHGFWRSLVEHHVGTDNLAAICVIHLPHKGME